jgi:hypothetical protein
MAISTTLRRYVGVLVLGFIIVPLPPERTLEALETASEHVAQGVIRFEEPISINEAIRQLSLRGIDVLQYHHQYQLGERVIRGGYLMPVSSHPTADEYFDAHVAALHNILETSLRQDMTERALSLEARLAGLEAISSDELRMITAVDVQGSTGQLVELHLPHAELILQPVGLRSSQRLKRSNLPRNDTQRERKDTPLVTETTEWWPYTGSITTDYSPGGAGGWGSRYVHQNFRWTFAGVTDLKNYGECTTFESDATYNNYDGLYFLGDAVGYWESDLPNAYLDTRFDDPLQERTFTIGAADVQDLEAYHWYYTYLSTDQGNASGDTGKVLAQRGHRYPCWCYSTWCVFGDDGHVQLGAWRHEVTGDDTYYFW